MWRTRRWRKQANAKHFAFQANWAHGWSNHAFFQEKCMLEKNQYKSKIHKPHIVLCFFWSNDLLPFLRLSVAFEVASSSDERKSSINAFSNLAADSFADRQDFYRLKIKYFCWFSLPLDCHFSKVRSSIDLHLYSRQAEYAFNFHNSDEPLV